jgi:hypothetical protein
VWGVRGEPARFKARTNNRYWPASADPPQKKMAGQYRASTGGCVKAGLGVWQSEAAPYKYYQQGRAKGMTGAERSGAPGGPFVPAPQPTARKRSISTLRPAEGGPGRVGMCGRVALAVFSAGSWFISIVMAKTSTLRRTLVMVKFMSISMLPEQRCKDCLDAGKEVLI